jgi:hypothetical protein
MTKVYTITALLLALSFTFSANAQNSNSNDSKAKFMASGSFGLGIRTAKIDPIVPSNLRQHYEDLKNGTFLSFELGVKALSNSAFSIGFSQFSAQSNDFPFSSAVISLGGPITGTAVVSTSDKITVVTANWINFLPLDKNQSVLFSTKIGAGTISFNSNNTVKSGGLNNSFELKGTGFVITGGIGLDFKITKNIFFIVNGDFLNGRAELKSNTVTAGQAEDEPESLSHLRFGGGLRFIL